MTASGLFINLYDETALQTYIASGVYGPLTKRLDGSSHTRSEAIHFSVLADLCCAKPGTHVFFFRKRRIFYGGQVSPNTPQPTVVLNGPDSPIAKGTSATQVWKEDWRPTYEPRNPPDRIWIETNGDRIERVQPYLILFRTDSALSGRWIDSDELYFELGKKHYPLPSNAIDAMSLCTLTPYEVTTLLSLVRRGRPSELAAPLSVNEPKTYYSVDTSATLAGKTFRTEAELEASVIANPELMPEPMRPRADATVCRQVPISPFKPSNMDRADICYYETPLIEDGSLPNTIIELKNKKASAKNIEQLTRYLQWIDLVAPSDAPNVRAFLLAPSYPSRGIRSADARIRLFTFAGEEYRLRAR